MAGKYKMSELLNALTHECGKCGTQLTVGDEWDDYHKWITVKVEPCEKCMEEARGEGEVE